MNIKRSIHILLVRIGILRKSSMENFLEELPAGSKTLQSFNGPPEQPVTIANNKATLKISYSADGNGIVLNQTEVLISFVAQPGVFTLKESTKKWKLVEYSGLITVDVEFVWQGQKPASINLEVKGSLDNEMKTIIGLR